MNKKKNSEKTVSEIYNDEITIGELIVKIKQLFSLLWLEKMKLLIIIIATIVLGLIIDYSSGREYEAENSIITYTRSGATGAGGNISGLAGLAGINLGDFPGAVGGQLVSENMLPLLIATYPVGSKLAEEPLRFYYHDEMSSYEYFRNVYEDPFLIRAIRATFSLPRRMLSFMNPSSVQMPVEEDTIPPPPRDDEEIEEALSPQDNPVVPEETLTRRPFFVPKSGMNSVIAELAERIIIVNEDGILKISAQMPDPYAAADLASLATELLMQELINFEVRKTRDQLNFMEEQYNVSRERFEQAQIALADFTDRNRGTLTAMAEIERQRLQNDYDLAFNIYSTWSRQVEETRMRLREDTPLFTDVDPVQVPSRPYRPNPVTTTIIATIVGVIWGVGYIVINRLYQSYKPAS